MSQMRQYQEIYFNNQLHRAQAACLLMVPSTGYFHIYQVIDLNVAIKYQINTTDTWKWYILAASDFAFTVIYTGIWYFVLLPGYGYEVLIPRKGTWHHEAALVFPALFVCEPVARRPRYASS